MERWFRVGLEMAQMQAIPRGFVLSGVVALVLAAVGFWVYLFFFDNYHFAAVDEGVLYRTGVKSMRQFQIGLADSRAKVVVMLVDEDEFRKPPFTEEWAYFQRSKVIPLLIPIRLGGFPKTEDVQKFLTNMEISKNKNKPVLVHCAQGVRRTGMMVAAYQMSILGWDKHKTKEAILTFGHSDRTVGDIKRFIDVYDPISRTVTADLGKGSEKGSE